MTRTKPPYPGTPTPDRCDCPGPHYPLRYFRHPRRRVLIGTRGTLPVARLIAEGWAEVEVNEREARLLHEDYDRSHRFDWLHTPTYLDDRETHLRMKALTAVRP